MTANRQDVATGLVRDLGVSRETIGTKEGDVTPALMKAFQDAGGDSARAGEYFKAMDEHVRMAGPKPAVSDFSPK
jgi:hypothetical protein